MLDLPRVADEVLAELRAARRPLLIYGWGIRLAGAVAEAKAFAELSKIPVVNTWAACDLPIDMVGGFGTHGIRAANFAVQNADYILSIGSRLDTKATGSPASAFAPKAKLTMLDIDPAELGKMDRVGRPLYRAIEADARLFLSMLAQSCEALRPHEGYLPEWDGYSAWWNRIRGWQRDYPPGMEVEGLNPYTFVRALGDYLKPDDVIVSDTGNSLGFMMQAFQFKGQRFIHAFNNTPMGYGLPAAVGAAFATGGRVVLVTGDGGLAVNITELATVARHNLNIKIILCNNYGHQMCRQTQRTWLNGAYPSTSYEGGLATPNYAAVTRAYGIEAWSVATLTDAIGEDGALPKMLAGDAPGFLELQLHAETQLSPQVQFGRALDDAHPLLPREELEEIRRV